MRPLSPRAAALISALHTEPSIAQRVLGTRAEADVAALEELASLAEPAVVPHLLAIAFGTHAMTARAAAHAIDVALAAATADELLALDEACRMAASPYRVSTSGAWTSLRPAELSRLSALGDAHAALLGVATFHASGHVREAAIAQLDALGAAARRELPFLLIRMNDWVAPVAARARAAVERRLVSPNAGAFLDGLPLLLRMGLRTRRSHRDLFERVLALLRADAATDGVVRGRGLALSDRAVRRIAHRLVREALRDVPGRPDENGALLRRALDDSDTVVRLEAAADLRQRALAAATAVDPAAIDALVADPYPPVRREGLVALDATRGEDATPRLTAALLDPNQVVREVARFLLTRRGAVGDFAAFYGDRVRDHTSTPRELATALAGLGETGRDAENVALVEPFLTHARPAVRRAVVRALAALDVDGRALPRLVGALDDPSPAVSRDARIALRPRAAAVGLAALQGVLRHARHAHGRRAAVSLGAALGKWDSLPILLEAAAYHADQAVSNAARRALAAWVAKQNRIFTPPSDAQLRAIAPALDDHHRAVDPAVVRELSAVLRFWGTLS